MAPLLSLADIRDIIVIIYGILGIVLFAILAVVAVAVFFMLKGLLHTVSEMLDESVKPTLESVKNAAETVRGTTEFVGKTAVTPIIRTYGAFAGVRKGLGVLTSLSGRKGK